MRRSAAVGLVLLAVFGVACFSVQAQVGIGAKFLGQVPFVVGNTRLGNIGGEIGAGFKTYGPFGIGINMLWYTVNGKYYLPFGMFGSTLSPYLGGGIVGIYVNSTISIMDYEASISGSAIGFEGLGGIEYSLAAFRLPFALFGGISWVSLNEMELSGGGETVTIPIEMSGLTWHVGARWDF
jgi:hypothetical protein